MEDNLNLIKRGIDELLNEAELISKWQGSILNSAPKLGAK